MPSKVRVHFSRDGQKPVCGVVGQGPFHVTTVPAEVTCRKIECRRESGGDEPFNPWRDEYQYGNQPAGT